MEDKYIYNEVLKPSNKSKGYGHIIDTKPEVRWENNMTTVFGKKKAIVILNSMNLYYQLSRLKKGVTKKELLKLLGEYGLLK